MKNVVEKSILVSVQMLTYKHEAYIRQAIESVLMQKTDFELDLIIADDCSPDKTPEIVNDVIRNNPKGYRIKYFRHEQNIGMQKNGLFALSKCKGKYIAICDGDDYWTDPYKLQKQVDFLEGNTNYSICFHKIQIFKEPENKLVPDYITREVNETTDIYELAKKNYIHTPSVVFRNIIERYPKELYKSPFGDYFLLMLIAQYGKIKKIDDVKAVYRVSQNGIWSGKKNKQKDILTYLNLMINYFQDERVLTILKNRRNSILRKRGLINRLRRKIINFLKA